jgi:hypothetical protein
MQGSYKFLSLSTGKKIVRCKFIEILVPDKVIDKVNRIGLKDKMRKGLLFKDRNGDKYKFDNDKEYEIADNGVRRIPSLFPEIAAEAPGVLTEREKMFGVDEVVHADPMLTDKDRAMLAAKNSGLDIGPLANEQPTHPEVIEMLREEDKVALDEHIKEKELPKIEPDAEDEQDLRRTTKTCNVPLRYNPSTGKDYELYAMVEEEEEICLKSRDLADEEDLAPVAHYVMMHYAEKESIKKKMRKFKPKQGQFGRHFGDRGETAVRKELSQFNLYDDFGR